MSGRRVESSGGLRGVVALGALAAAVTIAGATEPDVRAESARVDEARLTLRSDALAFATEAHLQAERSQLSARFARDFAIDPQAEILRRLAAALARHDVAFSSTQNGTQPSEAAATPAGRRNDFHDLYLSIELHGSYRGVLMVVDELARECELARVESASLHRSGDALNAHLSIALLRPVARSPRAAAAPGG